MKRTLLLTLGTWLLACTCLLGADKKTRIVLIGKDRDHAFMTHEYMADCALLARCLEQTGNVQCVVSNGWPKDPEVLKDVNALVLYTANGGNVLLGGPHRRQAEELLRSGVGLTAIHWSTGAGEGEIGEQYLKTLGGWFNTKFSKLAVKTTRLRQADAGHPICRGWQEYDLRDEYYLQLRFAPEIKPVMSVEIDGKEHTVGWVYERPESKGGRSFGFVCGHFHANFGEKPFRQAIVNGILWTAHRDVPAAGAPCEIVPKDLELPPDTRKKP
jgi:type 1 glutamine amidotransferase